MAALLLGNILGNLVGEKLLSALTVDKQVEWLQGQLRLMQRFLEVADEEKDAMAKNWVSEIRELVYDSEDVLDIHGISISRQSSSGFLRFLFKVGPNFAVNYKIAKEIQQIKTKLDEISCNRSPFDLQIYIQRESLMINNGPRLRETRRSFPEHGEPDYIVGLEEDAEALKQRLFGSNGGRVIAIVGTPGMGKTTLALKVYHDPQVKSYFDCCAWIYVSQEYKCQDLLEQIGWHVHAMGHSQGLITEAYLKAKLSEFLKGRRYLIVIDDVWKTEVWDDLKAAFPDVENGSKIILTTRNRRVASHADPRSLYHEPRVLNGQQSWELLIKRVFLEESNCPQNLVEIGKMVAKSCGGLPLAVMELGELLARKDPSFSAWSQVLARVHWHLNQANTTFSEALAMSYDDLPYHLKQRFLYFGIFPEGFEIPVRRLTGLWVSEGLVQQQQVDLQQQEDEQQNDGKSLEDTIDDNIKELIDRSMIEVVRKRPDGRPKSCRLPGVFYGLCLSKAAEVNLFHLHRNTAPVSISPATGGKVHRLADHSITFRAYPSNEPYLPDHLRSFISFNYQKGYLLGGAEIGSFLTRPRGLAFRGFRLLRVLDLEGVFMRKLPEELGDLIHLRYLGLRRTDLITLPESVGNLWALQILDLKYTCIFKDFPRSLWDLCQLRHLYLNDMYGSRFVHHSRGGSLANLQTLWGLFVDKNTQVRDGLDTLINLRKLGLTCQLNTDQMQEVAEWIVKLDKLQSLRLTLRDERGGPSDLILKPFSGHQGLRDLHLSGRLQNLFQVSELPPRLTNLKLSVWGPTDNPMPTLERHGHLVYLRFLANSFIEKKMVCRSRGFPQLLVLKLWNLEELEEWEVEQGALPSLVELEIRSCPRLQMLPHGLQYVKTLKTLKLIHMSDEFVAGVQAIKLERWSIDVFPKPATEAGPSSSP